MTIVKAKKKLNGVTSYAKVGSFSGNGIYFVVKYEKKYKCSCPDFLFRNRECKHIVAFKKAERINKKGGKYA